MKRKAVLATAMAAVMTASSLGTTALATTTDNSSKTAASSQSSSAQKTERHGHGKFEKVAEPDNAIGKDKAKAAALKAAGVSESKVDKVRSFVTKLDDGTVVYRVSFKYGEKYYAYKINATTGKVAEKKVQTAEEHEASKKEHGGKGARGMGKGEKSNSSTESKTS